MFSVFWTLEGDGWRQIQRGNLSSISGFLHSFLCEFAIWCMLGILVYYFMTLKRRQVWKTVAGVPVALWLIYSYFRIYGPLYGNIRDEIYDFQISPTLTFVPSELLWFLFLLAGFIAGFVCTALIMCLYNMVFQRLFSKRQILIVTIPIWLALAVCLGANLWFLSRTGHFEFWLIGRQEFLLALLFTFTLSGYQTNENVEIQEITNNRHDQSNETIN